MVLTSCRWWEIVPNIQAQILVLVSWGQIYSSLLSAASLLSMICSWASEQSFSLTVPWTELFFLAFIFRQGAQSPLNTRFAASAINLSQAPDPTPLPHVSWHSSGLFSFCHPFNFKFLHSFWYLWSSFAYFGTLGTIRKVFDLFYLAFLCICVYVCVSTH